MHLTVYTDYTLRVMMYLAVKYKDGGVTTIDEMARAYGISRNHLTKIVNELGQHGFIETARGRTGGARLARMPSQISVGAMVRMAEKDFAVVACHNTDRDPHCTILPACNLKNGMRRAVDAFLYELDKMTLEDAITAPTVAASLLHVGSAGGMEVTFPVQQLTTRRSKPRRGQDKRSTPARTTPRVPARKVTH